MNFQVFESSDGNLHAVQEKTRLSCKSKELKVKRRLKNENENEFEIKTTKKCKFMHTSN